MQKKRGNKKQDSNRFSRLPVFNIQSSFNKLHDINGDKNFSQPEMNKIIYYI